jgi:hypothetical protein
MDIPDCLFSMRFTNARFTEKTTFSRKGTRPWSASKLPNLGTTTSHDLDAAVERWKTEGREAAEREIVAQEEDFLKPPSHPPIWPS